jgi:voltage-gated potassium channel
MSGFIIRLAYIRALRPSPRLRLSLLLFGVALTMGTVGYWLIEDFTLVDAFYQTVITLSTVGFAETEPFDTAGKIFTSFLIVFGVGTVLYTLTLLVQEAVESDVRSKLYLRREHMNIEELEGHAIICGFGRVGMEIAREFRERGLDFVVIDDRPSQVDIARGFGYLVLEGDATEDFTLNRAGIHRAKTLLAASDSDSGNTFITLAAKSISPSCIVVARAALPHNEEKLRLAGADRVISLYQIGGRRMVLSALQPMAMDFMDTLTSGRHGDLVLAEFEVNEQNGLSECTCATMLRGTNGATLLGVRRANGELIVGPPDDCVLMTGDIVIALAEEEDIATIQSLGDD